jgi:hypothetical protein
MGKHYQCCPKRPNYQLVNKNPCQNLNSSSYGCPNCRFYQLVDQNNCSSGCCYYVGYPGLSYPGYPRLSQYGWNAGYPLPYTAKDFTKWTR